MQILKAIVIPADFPTGQIKDFCFCMPGELLMLPPDFGRPTHDAHNYALMGTWTHKGTTTWEIVDWEGDETKLKEIFSDSYHMGKWFEQLEPSAFAHIIESNITFIAKTVELFKPGMILSRIGRVIYCRNKELEVAK